MLNDEIKCIAVDLYNIRYEKKKNNTFLIIFTRLVTNTHRRGLLTMNKDTQQMEIVLLPMYRQCKEHKRHFNDDKSQNKAGFTTKVLCLDGPMATLLSW